MDTRDLHGEVISVGLVLGAGGEAANAWHAGVTNALADVTGWDARVADLILGTSAGAITGLCLRAGLAGADLLARQQGDSLSEEAQEIIDRVVTPYTEGRSDRDLYDLFPQSLSLTARSLWPPWDTRPLRAAVGVLPRGLRTTETLEQRLRELHPDPWPARRFWSTAVRLSDGERVVFGRDDVETTAAEAVRASCAVPAVYAPVTVDGVQYVDGGVHSYTNADLMGPPAFDVVVVSSVMSGAPDWSTVRGGLSSALSRLRQDFRPESALDRTRWSEALGAAWADGHAIRAGWRQRQANKLSEELEGLRRRKIAVLVVEPDADAVELMDRHTGIVEVPLDNLQQAHRHSEFHNHDGTGSSWWSELAEMADRTTRHLLEKRERFVKLLSRAAC